MSNLLKMERYQLSHNFLYWCGMVGIFLIGFFTAETYVPEVMGTTGGAATSLADIFNGMVYDSTFLLILMSSILALILGQEFSYRTVDLEITAGHSRKSIFFSKVITYLIAFNVMALVYPIAGCIREFFTTFVLSLYLGFGMMLKFPVAFLPTYQIREAVTSTAIFQPFPILIGIVWVVALLILSWCSFRKCELK